MKMEIWDIVLELRVDIFPVPPVDAAQDMRSEFLKVLRDMGIKTEKHHHEVAPSQHELGMVFDTLTTQADNMQLYKYGVTNGCSFFWQNGNVYAKAR